MFLQWRENFLFWLLFLTILSIFPLEAGALTVSPVRIEVSGEAGQTLQEELTLFNEEKEAKTFYSSLENFEARGESGRPYFTPGTEGLATWIRIQKEVTLEPGETKTIPFKIEIPPETEPGGYFAAIFWGSTPPEMVGGGQIMVGTKTGILVLLSVPGEMTGRAGIVDFSTKDKKKFFSSLPITFIYRFQNTYQDRIKPEGELRIKNIFGKTSVVLPANKIEGNVLPRSVRKFEVIWEGKNPEEKKIGFFGLVKKQWKDFQLGRYTAHLDLSFGPKNEKAQAHFSFFIIPWQLLILIGIFLALFIIFAKIGIRKYNQWIIAKALGGKKDIEK